MRKVLFSLILLPALLAFAEEKETVSYATVDPRAQLMNQEVTFDQKLNTPLPLDLKFRADNGEHVKLGDYFNNDKPVILNLVYYECPMLCNLQLNGLVNGLQDVGLTPGKEFDIVAVSFDHEETHVLASNKKNTYLSMYGKPETANGWHFLVGEHTPVHQLTDTCGFRFKYDPATDQYGHKSGLIIVTPEGRISRVLPGIDYPAKNIRLALVEASKGKIGTLADKMFLMCFQYDAETGKYTLAISNSLRVACLATVGGMGFFLFMMFKQENQDKDTPTAS